MFIALLIALLVSAGASAAVTTAHPGDTFYPVKAAVHNQVEAALSADVFGKLAKRNPTADTKERAHISAEANVENESESALDESDTSTSESDEVRIGASTEIKSKTEAHAQADEDSEVDTNSEIDTDAKVDHREFFGLHL